MLVTTMLGHESSPGPSLRQASRGYSEANQGPVSFRSYCGGRTWLGWNKSGEFGEGAQRFGFAETSATGNPECFPLAARLCT